MIHRHGLVACDGAGAFDKGFAVRDIERLQKAQTAHPLRRLGFQQHAGSLRNLDWYKGNQHLCRFSFVVPHPLKRNYVLEKPNPARCVPLALAMRY